MPQLRHRIVGLRGIGEQDFFAVGVLRRVFGRADALLGHVLARIERAARAGLAERGRILRAVIVQPDTAGLVRIIRIVVVPHGLVDGGHAHRDGQTDQQAKPRSGGGQHQTAHACIRQHVGEAEALGHQQVDRCRHDEEAKTEQQRKPCADTPFESRVAADRCRVRRGVHRRGNTRCMRLRRPRKNHGLADSGKRPDNDQCS